MVFFYSGAISRFSHSLFSDFLGGGKAAAQKTRK
jgi:hypothetical protein